MTRNYETKSQNCVNLFRLPFPLFACMKAFALFMIICLSIVLANPGSANAMPDKKAAKCAMHDTRQGACDKHGSEKENKDCMIRLCCDTLDYTVNIQVNLDAPVLKLLNSFFPDYSSRKASDFPEAVWNPPE
mgnify:CR=1 FL=1